jgi:hypothetical protein
MKYKKHFNKFVKLLDAKMKKGFLQYGDKSFDRPAEDLISELQAEMLDISGWGMILFHRLEEMRNKLKKKPK